MFLRELISVVFPSYCSGCGCVLMRKEAFLCVFCRNQLPETRFHSFLNNPLMKKFYGRCDLYGATSLLYFHKEGVVQKLIHQLKYKGNEQIGAWLGSWLGEKLSDEAVFRQTQVVVPVPLHPEKERLRGYNQVALFGKQLAQKLQAEYVDDVLVKIRANTSQTRKNLFQRVANSQNIFSVKNPEKIMHKRVLLVDDLITTGATVESCYRELTQEEGVKMGVVSMAYANKED
ncbi:amidophosphoribosyltransferase [Capnocytophaga canimorsus]|nr:amidophosphoribosyltransferase [Capnocytophaga canimorsus]